MRQERRETKVHMEARQKTEGTIRGRARSEELEDKRRRQVTQANKIRRKIRKFSNPIITLIHTHIEELLYNRISALLKGKEKTLRHKHTFSHTQSRNIHQQWTHTHTLTHMHSVSLSVSDNNHLLAPSACLLVCILSLTPILSLAVMLDTRYC